jgi:hypothetical protein
MFPAGDGNIKSSLLLFGGIPARPLHPRGAGGFCKKFAGRAARRNPAGACRPVEIWFQDVRSMRHSKALRASEPLAHSSESQGTPTRIWAKRGTRGSCARQRRRPGYARSASRPWTSTVNKQPAGNSPCVSVSAIALLILDGAGWPRARLIGPDKHVCSCRRSVLEDD